MSVDTNNGYSYKITITAEELSSPTSLSGASKMATTLLQPPKIDAKGTNTKLIEYTVTDLHHFAFNKIVEPRFDGIGLYTGQPVNFPDFISEHHFIGIMKATEKILAPRYEAMINSTTTSTTSKGQE
jgi:hypothetical protein